MNKSGEQQLQMNFDKPNSSKIEPESKPTNVESSFDKLCELLRTTEDKVDALAESVGSYGEALRLLGATQKQIDAVYRGDTSESSSETVEESPESAVGEEVIDTEISVNLGERALLLTVALKEFSAESGLVGFNLAVDMDSPHKRRIQDRYDDEQISNISAGGQSHLDKAYEAFDKAFDSEGMLRGGEDPNKVKNSRQKSLKDFKEKLVGPENKSDRAKFRRKMEKTLKRFEE